MMLSILDAPVSEAASMSGRAGVATAVAVMVTALVADEAVLPAISTVTALKLCTATASGVTGVNDQLPSASATTLPMMTVEPSLIDTEANGSDVPLNVGVALPVEVPPAGPTNVTVAEVSIVMARIGDAIERLPAASVAVVVMLCTPVDNVVDVKVQLPEPSAVTVVSNVAPS